jgi:hypothetical protein
VDRPNPYDPTNALLATLLVAVALGLLAVCVFGAPAPAPREARVFPRPEFRGRTVTHKQLLIEFLSAAAAGKLPGVRHAELRHGRGRGPRLLVNPSPHVGFRVDTGDPATSRNWDARQAAEAVEQWLGSPGEGK